MGIKITGMEELQKKLKRCEKLEAVKTVVKKNGSELQAKAQEKAPVDTGHLKRSIGLDITDEGLTAEIEPTADYAAYVEYGTRFMNAQPYMKPADNAQKEKFKSDMRKLVR